MPNEKTATINLPPASPSKSMIIEWMLKGELWRMGVGEDPSWGQHPVDQIVINATILELANNIADQGVREQIQASVSKNMVDTMKRFENQPNK